jgi:hypothetical protein
MGPRSWSTLLFEQVAGTCANSPVHVGVEIGDSSRMISYAVTTEHVPITNVLLYRLHPKATQSWESLRDTGMESFGISQEMYISARYDVVSRHHLYRLRRNLSFCNVSSRRLLNTKEGLLTNQFIFSFATL